MSEYWKSTPKYWCKHCSVYVRDTKLERANHESTGRHQGAIKRSLRDLHKNAEQAEREKERARREVERLNGVVSASKSSSSSSSTKVKQDGGAGAGGAGGGNTSQADRQRQLEQLAELGVAIPDELRRDMAMVGEWSVTSTRVLDHDGGDDGDGDEKKDNNGDEGLEGRAVGIKRAREMTEEEKEREEALNGLFSQSKRRKWGVGSKVMPEGEDEDLDALLSGGLVVAKKKKDDSEAEEKEIKEEEGGAPKKEEDGVQDTVPLSPVPDVKQEASSEVKQEEPGEENALSALPAALEGSDAPAVVFKKRKPKNIRQK